MDIELPFTLEEILRGLDAEEWVPMSEAEDGEVRSLFVGTVFNIMPSGKYYTPWSMGNVTPCPTCGGAGCDECDQAGSLEVLADELFHRKVEMLRREADRQGRTVSFENGEDPCDLFFAEYRYAEDA